MPPPQKAHHNHCSHLLSSSTQHFICDEYENLLFSLEPHFLVVGDRNAKNTAWDSTFITPKGRSFLRVLQHHNMNYLSTGESTNLPSDPNKRPDLINFAINKEISDIYCDIKANYYLAENHSSFIIKISAKTILNEPVTKLISKHTNWDKFQNVPINTINLNLRLKVPQDLETAIEHFTKAVQEAAWLAILTSPKYKTQSVSIPLNIKALVAEKRARKKWQRTRNGLDKTFLYRPTYTQTHSAARSNKAKVKAFAEHLSNVFTSPPAGATSNDNDIIISFLYPVSHEVTYTNIHSVRMEVRSNYYGLQARDKPPTKVTSYRSVSLLLIVSKLFERLLFKRIRESTDSKPSIWFPRKPFYNPAMPQD
ncbi:hypothetical protein ILUMI_26371 [Ignelater luminosus]|uniref:Endonuclease/exonuclease/phosphatase domain-containing protein n=1 Tax=Ignelater luminosus TaxID=2038154 RepID=A0A8K0FYQ6_IGNLU|nr:hypothetical protein ILUMI_26371 [Ignelater luminosus]